MAFLKSGNDWYFRPKHRDADARQEITPGEYQKFQGDRRPKAQKRPGKTSNDLPVDEFNSGAIYWLADNKLWVGEGETQLRTLATLFANGINKWHTFDQIKQAVYGKRVDDEKLRNLISRLRDMMKEHGSDNHAFIVCQPKQHRYAMMEMNVQTYRNGAAPKTDSNGNVIWFGKHFLPAEKTKLRDLFFLLADRPGRTHPTVEIEQFLYGETTDESNQSFAKTKQVDAKIRRLISRLNELIKACDLDNRVMIQSYSYHGHAYRVILLPEEKALSQAAA